jgi:hypothetical protein
MYTTDAQAGNGGTVSATDEERLPPGGFTLRHGFPEWVDRSTPAKQALAAPQKGAGIYEVLRYMRSTFDDAEVLDRIPLEAAGNEGAWHAWRTHRIKIGKIKVDGEAQESGAPKEKVVSRKPGEWNWDGVWEVRVKKSIEASLSEPMLFGNTVPGDDLVSIICIC